MVIRVHHSDFFVLNLRTRMPFRYGIATLRALPHLIVRATVEVDGKTVAGFAADGLPPKWFTKDPTSTYAQELADMVEVIRHACALAREISTQRTPFALWRSVYEAQSAWARGRFPALLSNFGVSLIERAVIDGFCRATGAAFHDAVRTNALGMELGDMHEELAARRPADFLPAAPLERIVVRHTIGLADPLSDADVRAAERLNDGLPQTLEESIPAYGLIHFKIKLAGDVEQDVERLRQIAALLDAGCPNYRFTLDGNENYRNVEPFRRLWEKLAQDPSLAQFMSRLIFVEQPLHRDLALSAESRRRLRAWADRPRMIIDESDDSPASLPRALDGGYIGTSHKNCKGVFKGIGSACLIAHRRRVFGGEYTISAEDLTNVGPVALLEDLAVIATLGIAGAERNGHHYFAGLSAFPGSIQEEILVRHADLYRRHPGGFPTLRIERGSVSVGSVIAAPFGVSFNPDLSALTPLDAWDVNSLDR